MTITTGTPAAPTAEDIAPSQEITSSACYSPASSRRSSQPLPVSQLPLAFSTIGSTGR